MHSGRELTTSPSCQFSSYHPAPSQNRPPECGRNPRPGSHVGGLAHPTARRCHPQEGGATSGASGGPLHCTEPATTCEPLPARPGASGVPAALLMSKCTTSFWSTKSILKYSLQAARTALWALKSTPSTTKVQSHNSPSCRCWFSCSRTCRLCCGKSMAAGAGGPSS